MFDKLNSTGYLANHMARLLATGLRRRIEPLGIVPGQFAALLELWESDGQTQSELVRKLDVEQPTLANTLSRMERDGLIRRTEHPSDARAKLILLTRKAKDIRDRAYEAADAQNAAALAQLTSREHKELNSLMRKVIATLREE